jgi:hypothetical protein
MKKKIVTILSADSLVNQVRCPIDPNSRTEMANVMAVNATKPWIPYAITNDKGKCS